MKIYHNPRCRKSREALQIITDNGIEPQVIEYLKNPPTKDELLNILSLANVSACDLIRKNEQEYKDNYKGKNLTEQDCVEAILKFPKLMERPIVLSGGKGVVARPPEKVTELLN